MKVVRTVAFILVILAVLLTATGGMMDIRSGSGGVGSTCPCMQGRGAAAGGLFISKSHIWNDGLFLVLIAIFLLVAFND
jgi:hypothetical protein